MSSCANIWQVRQEITGSLKAFIKNNRANKRPLLPGSSLLSLVHAVAGEHGDDSVTSRYTTAALITAFALLLFTRIPAEPTGLHMCSHVSMGVFSSGFKHHRASAGFTGRTTPSAGLLNKLVLATWKRLSFSCKIQLLFLTT